jgi:Sulfotransferase family
MTAARPIVIVGLPRSGTTWTLQALACAAGTTPIPEHDNEDKHPASIHAKRKVGRYPALSPGDVAPAYRKHWDWIFKGASQPRRARWARYLLGPGAVDRIHEGRADPASWMASTLARDPRPKRVPDGQGPASRIVAKSIHAQLSVEWLADEFDIDVLLLLRHPANVLASWMELNLKDARNTTLETRPEIRSRYLEPWGVPQPGPDPIERMSWRIGLLTAAIEQASSHNPDWIIRTHERLCTDPLKEFRQVYADLALDWGEPTEEFLLGNNAPGSGFAIKRVASEMSDSWRRRLDADQVETLRRVLALFPITTWTDRDFAPEV